jgi:uncharacterized membrane protein
MTWAVPPQPAPAGGTKPPASAAEQPVPPPAPADQTNILTETQIDHLPKRKAEVGMRFSPEVVLFVGAMVLTVLLFAVFTPFMVRIWRNDAASRRSQGPSEGGGR